MIYKPGTEEQTREEIDFWKEAYVACLRRGCMNNEAKRLADLSVQDLREYVSE